MKKLPSVKAFMAIIASLLVFIAPTKVVDGNRKIINNSESIIQYNGYQLLERDVNNELLALNEEKKEEASIEVPEIVYDGMTLEELGAKLDKNLKSTLKGYGMVFAEYAIKYNVDPYIATAIVLHETGCGSGKCSTLTSKCNNIGGMKGKNTCGNSSYAKFKSLDAGIEAFFKNLSNNYFKKGLTTPDSIGRKYAESKTWSNRIKYYVRKIKES